MKPSLATQVRSLGLPDRLVRAVEEIQQLLRVGAGVLPGDKAEQWVTRGELVQWGFATEPGGGLPLLPAGPGTPGTPGSGSEVPDYTPPPTPENVQAIGGYTSIFVVWDAVRDRRIGYFEVWRASVDDIGQAVKIGQTTSFQYIDEVQNSARYYYWVRSVNAWDDAIVSPFNAVAGTPGETAPDASYVLELLTGQITESQLHADLGSRIDLIDADESVAGSVGARIKATQTTLENADAVLAQQMMTLSAGIGEQFDSYAIWYFDAGTDGWGGNGAPIASGGWIRPANHATDAYLVSPANVDAPAATFPQLKLRIKRVGAPTWEGFVWWRFTPSTWDLGNRISFPEPSFDASGIAVVTIDMPWTGTINGIRLDLSSASSATDHYALDWVAIGRAAPGASVSALQRESTVRAQADQTMAQDITTLQSISGGNTVAIQQEATTRASETGSLFAKYTVKIDANGYVSGFGLASTANNATPFSEFAVRADRFSIASPSGPGITPVVPFAVQTTPTTIDGITFQPGVYMTQAVIKKAIVENFVAGLAVIDDASIKNVRAGKILADKLGVGQYIESQGYIAGSSGWRISANGTAEFQTAVVRGTVYASAGAIAGVQIFGSYLQSSNYVAGANGYRLNADGTAEFGNLTARGNITANKVAAGASITSPVIYGGSYGPSFAWPNPNSGGYHLSNTGLLMGNYNGAGSGSYIYMLGSSGYAEFNNVYIYGNAVVRGDVQATSINAESANIVSTLNIANNAVTFPVGDQRAADSNGNGATAVAYGAIAGRPILVTGFTNGGPYGSGSWGYGGTVSCYLQVYNGGWVTIATGSTLAMWVGTDADGATYVAACAMTAQWTPSYDGNYTFRVVGPSSMMTGITILVGKR